LKRKIATLFLLLVTLFGGVNFVESTPAQAATATGSMYFYNNTNGTDLLEQIASSISPKSVCHQMASLDRNLTGYIKNTSPYYWYVFDSSNCTGFPGTIYPNTQGPMNGDWNNKIESFYRATGP
jgi:hypothetical protein